MLSNRDFSKLVNEGRFPEQVIVPLDPPFVNANGEIQNLLLEKFTSAAMIRSVPGSVRANHVHKTDWHYSYVVTGRVAYCWRPVGATVPPTVVTIEPGQMFFTPPNVEHAMVFPVETVFLTLARNVRDHDHHEEDLIRVPLVEVKPDAARPGHFKVLSGGTEIYQW